MDFSQVYHLPFKHNLFSLLMFLGVVQALLLSFVFIFKMKNNLISNRLLGLGIFAQCLTYIEILLCYSGYVVYAIHLVDVSEPCNFLFGPIIFLYTRAILTPGFKFKKTRLLHFLPFIFYVLYSIPFYILPPEVKYNAFISAYHPTVPHLPVMGPIDVDPLAIKDIINTWSIGHYVLYWCLGFGLFYKRCRELGVSFWAPLENRLKWLRNILFIVLTGILFNAFLRIIFREVDLGDHILTSYNTVLFYVLTIFLISRSSFFMENIGTEKTKYRKSALTKEMIKGIETMLAETMKREKPYLESTFSLPQLANRLNCSQNHLSQVLNESMGQTFFEYIASLRIEEAKKLLAREQYRQTTIEEISEMVGYNSKSAFNIAFKKITSMTPSAFRKNTSG